MTAPGGIPTTAGTIGGLSGQAASGPINSPSGNTGIPTVQQTMGGPAGTTGTNQGDPNNLNTFPTVTNTGGTISGGGTTGGVLLSTPFVSFPSPVPTAGISDAGRAGIGSNTSTGASGTAGTTFSNGVVINPAALNGPGRLINDVGPSEFIGAVNNNSGAAPSLGEIAAQFKTRQNGQNARTLTNADIERMIGSNTNAQPATVAGNMPSAGLPAQNTPASSTPQNTADRGAAPVNNSTAAQQSAPAQSAAASQSGATAQGSDAASSSTTPQINQGQSGGSNANTNGNENSRLPATSTFLPLLGLLGVASGGIGLWYRRFRK